MHRFNGGGGEEIILARIRRCALKALYLDHAKKNIKFIERNVCLCLTHDSRRVCHVPFD
jgi:hypothetical protein